MHTDQPRDGNHTSGPRMQLRKQKVARVGAGQQESRLLPEPGEASRLNNNNGHAVTRGTTTGMINNNDDGGGGDNVATVS